MTALLGTLAFTAAVLAGARCFALYLARLSEGVRPPMPSDDVFGDVVNLPSGFLFHAGENAR